MSKGIYPGLLVNKSVAPSNRVMGNGIWSGTLPEAGFYEFVVVSTASEPVDYQLNIDTAGA